MSVHKDQMDVTTIVIILLEAISVAAWMDMNWNQIIILVQVNTIYTNLNKDTNTYILVLHFKYALS